MQNIPDSVKALFRSDSVRKNLRISFPDGQMPDITNENIVSESMRLDESISTRDTFTFGLADGSVLSFETVGIGNMLGYRIEASLEIDASTLPAELQTVKADVPFPVYPFPLGSFIVTSCPRNHQAMAHRKVTAKSGLTVDAGIMSPNIYSIFYKEGDWSTPKQGMRLMMPISCDTAFRLMKHDLSEPNPAYISTLGSADKSLDRTVERSLSYLLQPFYSGTKRLKLYASTAYVSYSGSACKNTADGALSRAMLRVVSDASPEHIVPIDDMSSALADELIAANPDGITLGQGGLPASRAMIIHSLRASLQALDYGGQLNHYASPANGDTSLSANNSVGYIIGDWSPIMCYRSVNSYNHPTFRLLTSVSVEQTGAPVHYFVDDETVARGTVHSELQLYQKPLEDCTAFEAQRFDINPHFIRRQSGGTAFFQWLDSDLLDRYMSAVEMNGGVVQYKHSGGQQIRFLSKDSPIRIPRELYEKLWWDEYDIEPIGSVAYKWKDAEQVYQFGEGRSTYQLTNNGLIDALPKKKSGTRLGGGGGTSTATIETILDAGLVPHLADSTYTPIELTAKGLPFLEPGDYIEIETDTGELVKSYILSRKLKGIQHLTDSITADGTTIVEVD